MKAVYMDGYVCGNIEVRSTKSGKKVTQFSVNSPDRRKNKQTGEWESTAQFFACQYWHKSDDDHRAALITDKAHVVLVGDLKYEEWETESGKRNRVIVNVAQVFNDAKPQVKQAQEPALYDDDCPF